MVLSQWQFPINRWSRLSGAVGARVARLGEFLGAGTLVGGAVAGLGLPQLILFGAGAVLATITMLGIPVWFLLLGGS